MTVPTTPIPTIYEPRCFVNFELNFPGYTFITVLVDIDQAQAGLDISWTGDLTNSTLALNFTGNFLPPSPSLQPVTRVWTTFFLASDEMINHVSLIDASGEEKQGTVSRPIGKEDDAPEISNTDFECSPIVFKSVTNDAFFSGGTVNVPNGSSLSEMTEDVPTKTIQIPISSINPGDGTFSPYYQIIDGVAVSGEYNYMQAHGNIVPSPYPKGYFINTNTNPPINLYTAPTVIIL